MEGLPRLTIIQSTHASMGGLKSTGLLERHARLVQEYAKTFDVVIYSSDSIDYSSELGVTHKPVPWLPAMFGWRHLVYYLWLVWQAPRMRGVIKVFGSNIPTLFLVRVFSGCPMMVTYQLNYAEAMRGSERNLIKRLLGPLLERLALSPADLVLVTAEWLGTKVRTVYRKPTLLLPNWVDLSKLDTEEPHTERSKYLILYAGRLHWLKGVNILIEAFACIKASHPQASLVICGAEEENEEAKLYAQVQSLGVADIEFRGRVQNVQVLELMRSAAIFVLPTITMEGHPKSLIEAMACGAACIATDVPGNQNVITNGENGLLVQPANAEVLAEAIGYLLSEPEVRLKLGENAQRDTRQLGFDVIVPQEIQALLSLYAQHN